SAQTLNTLSAQLEPLRIARHVQVAAPQLAPGLVAQQAQALPVDRARGAAAVELLRVEQRLHAEAPGGRVHAPLHGVERAAARAAPAAQRREPHRLRAEGLCAGFARTPPGAAGPQRATVGAPQLEGG